METKPPPGIIIWINGFPGVGKLSIARKLVERLTDCGCGAVLIDNHQLIDPVTLLRDHPDYNVERRAVRQTALARYVLDPDSEAWRKVVIFTDFQTDNALGSSVAAEYLGAARRSGRPLLPVYVTCAEGENLRRICGRERREGGTGKLVDPAVLKSLRDGSPLCVFQGVEGVEVDSTELPLESAAAKIRAELWSRFPSFCERYGPMGAVVGR